MRSGITLTKNDFLSAEYNSSMNGGCVAVASRMDLLDTLSQVQGFVCLVSSDCENGSFGEGCFNCAIFSFSSRGCRVA